MKRLRRTKKAGPQRTKLAAKSARRTKAATKSVPAANHPTPPTGAPTKPTARSKSARAHIAEGTRLFALAGRPTKAQFIKVYGPKGPAMTWAQREAAGVDAKHFQAALATKGGA